MPDSIASKKVAVLLLLLIVAGPLPADAAGAMTSPISSWF